MKRQSGFQKSVDQIFEKLAVFLIDRNLLETPNFYSGFGTCFCNLFYHKKDGKQRQFQDESGKDSGST
ncbi:hypothetical protein [Faecalimonas umbilicata]|uniref:hypothetical protein n=1 Tax=Faecalimonas umbilicata TaxID=1912855 RepID=UPI0036F219C0